MKCEDQKTGDVAKALTVQDIPELRKKVIKDITEDLNMY